MAAKQQPEEVQYSMTFMGPSDSLDDPTTKLSWVKGEAKVVDRETMDRLAAEPGTEWAVEVHKSNPSDPSLSQPTDVRAGPTENEERGDK